MFEKCILHLGRCYSVCIRLRSIFLQQFFRATQCCDDGGNSECMHTASFFPQVIAGFRKPGLGIGEVFQNVRDELYSLFAWMPVDLIRGSAMMIDAPKA